MKGGQRKCLNIPYHAPSDCVPDFNFLVFLRHSSLSPAAIPSLFHHSFCSASPPPSDGTRLSPLALPFIAGRCSPNRSPSLSLSLASFFKSEAPPLTINAKLTLIKLSVSIDGESFS